MKKYIRLLIVSLFFFLLSKTSPVEAAVIFSDSFSGGYNGSLWTIFPGQFAPISSPFGISVDPLHANDYSSLVHNGTLPQDVIIKVDMKINTSPASDMGIFINNIHNLQSGPWKNAYLFGVGVGGTPNTILLRDSNNFGNASGPWDTSIGIHHIELSISGSANSLMSLKEDGNTLLTWISSTDFIVNETILSLYGTGSEFANYQLCDSNGCASPTPSPSPSPTPIPTPVPVTKVVVIPGFGGSWNGDAITNCKKDGYSGTWTSYPGSDLVYGNLLSSIQNSGFVPEPFYYDWRKDIDSTKFNLKDFINATVSATEKVDMVGHSMGGLVGRAYIEQERGNNKADKYLSAGTPHKGLLSAYSAWSAGKIEGDIFWKIGAATVIHKCEKLHPELSDREIIQQFFPSVQNMLPIFDYLKNAKTSTVIPVASMSAQNNFLNPPLFINTLVGTLSGYGTDTLQFLDVASPSKRDVELGDWLDGKPRNKEYSTQGDGTVLILSSMLDGATNKQLPLDHLNLVHEQLGIGAILQFLSTGTMPLVLPQKITPSIEPKSALVIIGYPASFSVTIDGNTVRDKQGIVVFVNPKAGSYHLHLMPTSKSTQITIGQFLPNDQILWKDYQWKGKSPKDGTIQFDSTNPIEDALK